MRHKENRGAAVLWLLWQQLRKQRNHCIVHFWSLFVKFQVKVTAFSMILTKYKKNFHNNGKKLLSQNGREVKSAQKNGNVNIYNSSTSGS